MSEFSVEIASGNSKRLLTAGKYCDRDIVVTTSGGGGSGYIFEKIASDYECVRAVTTISLKSYDWWQSVTVENIYCVTKQIVATAAGSFSKNATCEIEISYSNGVISLNRTGLSGSLVLSFIMDIYVILPLIKK